MFCNGKEPYAKMVPTVGVCTGSSTYKVYQESELPGGVFPRESVKDRKGSLRLLRQETVDHIFPIHEMETSAAVRRRAALHGIKGSNDVKNLCAACRRCNLRKGIHMGRWIRKAFLGRMTWYWPAVKILRLAAVCLVLYAFGRWQPDIISFVWESVQKLKF